MRKLISETKNTIDGRVGTLGHVHLEWTSHTYTVEAPPPPTSLSVTFFKDPRMPLPNVIGTITVNPPAVSDNVTSRAATVVLNNAAPLTLDLTSGTATFPCMVGDSYIITAIDTNASGPSPASDALSGVVSVAGPVVPVPAPPSGLAVTFAEAP